MPGRTLLDAPLPDAYFAFLEEHIVFIDSPHEGRPGTSKDGSAVQPTRPQDEGDGVGYPLTSTHGLAALPTRTPTHAFRRGIFRWR